MCKNLSHCTTAVRVLAYAYGPVLHSSHMPSSRKPKTVHTKKRSATTLPKARRVRAPASKLSVADRARALHKRFRGKIEVRAKTPLTPASLELLYTPGVGTISSDIARMPECASEYTLKGRTIAVVSDGSAVLGLGNIGPLGALPVMEGKALLFKELAGIDAVPIVLGTQDPEEILQTVLAIAPTFGGINLEDIAAPNCFMIEERLRQELSIPVMHDDQHGTAIVVLAGLINAHAVVGKDIRSSRIAVIGAGAAGIAITKFLLRYGVGDILLVDSNGIIGPLRTDLTPDKEALVPLTNKEQRSGGAFEAMTGADAVVGVSRAGSITRDHVRMMAQRSIVFALANPEPEIHPDEAHLGGAAVVATGRSDYPNQVNNALVFPGVFKGALEHGVTRITTTMELRAAEALARLIARPKADKILPTLFDRRVVKAVASAIK
jgi:malate dehydrogenase (oxaloacetate-decarboxylating)